MVNLIIVMLHGSMTKMGIILKLQRNLLVVKKTTTKKQESERGNMRKIHRSFKLSHVDW